MLNWIPGLSPFVARFRLSVKKKNPPLVCLNVESVLRSVKWGATNATILGWSEHISYKIFQASAAATLNQDSSHRELQLYRLSKRNSRLLSVTLGKKRSPFLFGLLSNQLPSSHDEAEKKTNSVGNGLVFFNGIWTVDWDMIRVLTVFKSAHAGAKPSKAKHEQPDKTADWTWQTKKRKRIKTRSERQELKTGQGGESHCRHKQRTDAQSASANSQLR